MKKKNKGEPPLRLAIVWILLILCLYVLSEFKYAQAISPQGLISPVPDGYSDVLAHQPYLLLQPTTEKEEIKVEETIDEQIEEYGKFLFKEDWNLFKGVIWCESRNDPEAFNGADTGLAQINVVHGIPKRWLVDYRINLAVAKKLFDEQGLTPWNASKHCWSKR